MTVSAVTLVRLLLWASTLMLVWMTAVIWMRRRRAPESVVMSMLSAAAALYCFGSSQEIAQTSLPSALFWIHVEYLGIPWLPALWLWLARRHHGLRSNGWLLWSIPVVAFVGQWTSSLHGFFYRTVAFLPRPPFWIVDVHRGPIAWLHLSYLYFAFLYGAWLYFADSRSSTRLFRRQSLLFAVSSFPPIVGYLAYLAGWTPWNLDIAPVFLAFSVTLAYTAVVRYECFDLVPMARSLVFNSMRDAAVVTDMHFRLVELNPAARALLPHLGNAGPGSDLAAEMCASLGLQHLFRDPSQTKEIEMKTAGESRHYEVRALPLSVADRQAGWAVLFADVSSRVRLFRELRRHAETDVLTGIANRRCFVAAIELECARSSRHHAAFSVVFGDIDEFKSVNDRYGHVAGDTVLQAVADRIASCLRRIDLLSRYGGDEFAILLPETGPQSVLEVAERIRSVVSAAPVEWDEQPIPITVSLGVATYDPGGSSDWAHVLDAADQALYRAKADGRNRVAGCDEIPTVKA